MSQAAANARPQSGRTVLAPINFMAQGQAEKPRVFMSADHAQPNQRTGDFKETAVQMLDARALAPAASLDVQGFELATMPTTMADFYDEATIEATYYPE
ncbi:MAG: hypothetical protein RLO05_00575, partial [Rhodospirillales bacterium]